ncbi:FKBP-type peptidyl-prolyl cis-trans isomerase N-terminal domain-containing protein [Paraferrimonas sp. SM1919]|uniref:FKBP-type peptidyl-prolyl cis-trans isomerase N-terminal domain-containing protein n=1 Tax=Paraferrimonas sp. SM1919 TaxID=2662263 RepID=UPI0013D0FBD1|nr:FKBP-type peptidyl-prolyl cis-trans isomerase N-terminal domain-containing protein [Paraferrimonas sp. SM1919]
MDTLEKKISYIMGRELAEQLLPQAFKGMNIKIVQQAIMDTFSRQPWPFDESQVEDLKELFINQQRQQQEQGAAELEALSQRFFADNAKRAEVFSHSTGVQYEIVEPGSDAIAFSPNAKFIIHHQTFLLDGRLVDSSLHLDEPNQWLPTQMPLGWMVALKDMQKGSKWRVFIPSHLAYGEEGTQTIPGNSPVVCEIQLIDVING